MKFIWADKSLLETLKIELEDYDIKGTTIHFTAENPLLSERVAKIVQLRIKSNEARVKNR